MGRPDRLIGNLAERQHGVVARPQLLEAGISRRSIERYLESGRLRILIEVCTPSAIVY
jgi:hypothetical protein